MESFITKFDKKCLNHGFNEWWDWESFTKEEGCTFKLKAIVNYLRRWDDLFFIYKDNKHIADVHCVSYDDFSSYVYITEPNVSLKNIKEEADNLIEYKF